MNSWHTYPSIYNLGHRYVADLLLDPVLVEEKVDGSQFSFGYFPDSDYGLRFKSKGAEMPAESPEKMFKLAVDAVKARKELLTPGWTYRAEVLCKPKHNTLVYNRVPNDNLIIFDIDTGEEDYLTYGMKKMEADRLGFEVVPCLDYGMIGNIEVFRDLLKRESVLGGSSIEGVVIKNYNRFGLDKKVLMGKFVSEAFKEAHTYAWTKENPTGKDILGLIQAKYRTEARWQKAVQHLRELGQIQDAPQDIGLLIREIKQDTEKDSIEDIKDDLYKWAWPHIQRGLTYGFPEWYKEQLVKLQFERGENDTETTSISASEVS